MRVALFLIFISSALFLNGQTISGTIISETGDTIPFASVSIMKPGHPVAISSVYSDEDGFFKVASPASDVRWFLEIMAMGFENFKTDTFTGGRDFGALKMQQDAMVLDELDLTFNKKLIKNNGRGLDVDVSASPILESSNAKEILSKIPGVVLNQDGSLSLNGQTDIQVFINGKPTFLSLEQLVQQLESTPGTDIKKIEVYNTPPAKFDAEGAGGIINIVKKENTTEGFNVNTGINAGMGKYPKANSWLNFNYRKGKLNFYGNLNGRHDTRFFIQKFELTTAENVNDEIHNTKIPKFTNRHLSSKLGLDYSIDTNTTIGIMASPYVGDFTNYETLDAYIIEGNYNYDKTLGFRDMTNRWKGGVYNINLERKINKGSWNFDLDYIYNFDNSTQLTQSEYWASDNIIGADVYNTNWDVHLNATASKVDFEKDLKNDWNMESGLKFIDLNQKNRSFSSLNGKDANWTNQLRFTYKEQISAGYFTAAKAINEKWKTDFGFRAEYTLMNGKTDIDSVGFNQTFLSFFPNVSISFDAHKNWKHSWSYTRRIKRPEYIELTPFEQRLNPYLISIGNPNLKPQFYNQLNYTLGFFQYFNLNVNFGLTNNSVFLTPTSNEEELIQRFQYQNLGENHNVNVSINGPAKPFDWWTIIWNATVFRNQLVNSPNYNFDYTSFYIRLQNQFNFKKGWKAEFTGFYHHKHYWQVWYQSEFVQFDASISKKYKNWKFNIVGTDIFGLRYHLGGYNQGAVQSINYFEPEKQIFRLSIAYSFGNQKLKKQRDRGTGADDVKERTSN